MRKRLLVLCTVVPVVVAALIAVVAASAAAPAATATVHAKWVTGLGLGLSAGSGSTVGPDGALYANDPVNGRVVRVDAATGAASVYADCLPKRFGPVLRLQRRDGRRVHRAHGLRARHRRQ